MISRLLTALCLCLVASPTVAQESRPAPEAASGTKQKSLVVAERHMVVAAEPLAAEAGREILRQGGSAADAAIATELVLGLVEPQSSGLGGGAFLVYWDSKTRSISTIDGRETAPAAAKPDRFMRDGKPMPFEKVVLSGLSVGTPGLMRTLESLHRKFGKLPWASLFAPAIKLAENGFPVSHRLAVLLEGSRPQDFSAGARAYFFDQESKPPEEGSLVKNQQYAETLKVLAEKGADAFYAGPIADSIVKAVSTASSIPGDMTSSDLSG
jgi:gamma-glutamyltranspeptidase/glutathione hydrolase